MQEKALEIASHVTNPGTLALMALIIAWSLFNKVPKKARPWFTWFMAMIISFSLALFGAQIYLQSRNLYRVRVMVLGADKQPVEDVKVTSSVGGEPKRVAEGWEFDIPPESKPADGKLTLYADLAESFLTGRRSLVLGKEYFPTVEIQLEHDVSAIVRGTIVDEHGRFIAGANVSVAGFSDSTVSDTMGNFAIPAHTANSQTVRLLVQKGKLRADKYVQAGEEAQRIVVE